MKILHVAASMSSKWGGPPRYLAKLTEELAKKDIQSTIYATYKINDKTKVIIPKGVNLKLFPCNFIGKIWTSYSYKLKKAIYQEINNYDIIHIHEIWHFPHYIAYKAAKKFNKPYIVTVHGELSPWCLSYKKIKKKIYSSLIQRRILREAKIINALTNEEEREIVKFSGNKRIKIVPVGINPNEFKNNFSKRDLNNLYPKIENKKVILFLGRVHQKKGIDLLIKAFTEITKKRKDICLLIVGPIDKKYKDEFLEISKNRKSVNLRNIIFTGLVDERKKLIILSNTDIFVLPSYSEGFSMAVLEAMCNKLPVIVTHQCNFQEITKVEAGIVINPCIEELVKALNELLSNQLMRKKMGGNGYRLILRDYTWEKITNQMIKIYDYILENKDF